jgi:NAD(P)-dependent dehydrogenase (short-subunit alcohol dehydrogenase family)
MDLQLEGKVALVTGSSRGTGAQIAATLASEGAAVIVHAIEEGAGEEVRDTILGQGNSAHLVQGDIRADAGANEVSDQVKALGLQVDILVNNFGAAMPSKWLRSSVDDWKTAFEANLFSAVRMINHFAGPMRQRGWGRIIQLGTIGSTRPGANMPGYYMAKASLAASMVSLMKELSGTGITVNGTVWPDIEKAVVEKEMPNPVGRIARRDEIADLVCFVASPKAGYINGQNIRIDGGAVDLVS